MARLVIMRLVFEGRGEHGGGQSALVIPFDVVAPRGSGGAQRECEGSKTSLHILRCGAFGQT
jgi:hypothetical protein